MANLSFSKREKIYERDNYTCHYCGLKADVLRHEFSLGRIYKKKVVLLAHHFGGYIYFEVDHIVPVSKGGKNNIDNLVTACSRCNNTKHTKDYDEFMLEIGRTKIVLNKN